jgi:hypothetical protein
MNDALHRAVVIVTGFVAQPAECHEKCVYLLRFQPAGIRVASPTLDRRDGRGQTEGSPWSSRLGVGHETSSLTSDNDIC